MLTFDFNRKAPTIFQNNISVRNMFFLHTDIKSTSIWRKIEVRVESNFHFGPPIDVSNLLNAITTLKCHYFRGI